MNVSQKETRIVQCEKCPDTFLKVGEIGAIRLAHRKTPHKNPSGEVMKGTCPKHNSERTTL